MDGLERRGKRRGSGKESEKVRRRLVSVLVDKIAETCDEEQPEALALEIAELDRILVEALGICKELDEMGSSESREFVVRITPEHVKLVHSKRGALGAPRSRPSAHPF